MKLLLFTLLVVFSAFAQDNPSIKQPSPLKTATTQQQCPLVVNYLLAVGNNQLEINWTNTNDKVITAFKFAVQYTDSFGQPLINTGYDGFERERINIKPGKKGWSVFTT